MVIGRCTKLEDSCEKEGRKNRSSRAEISQVRGFGQLLLVPLKEVLNAIFADEEDRADCSEKTR